MSSSEDSDIISSAEEEHDDERVSGQYKSVEIFSTQNSVLSNK